MAARYARGVWAALAAAKQVRLADALPKMLLDDIYTCSMKKQTGVSLRYMLDFGANPIGRQLILSAQFLHNELPVRLAHRVAELENLPYGLSAKPHVIKVRDWYVESFRELREFPRIQDINDEAKFTDLLRHIYHRHRHVVPVMAMGVAELKKELHEGLGLNEVPEIHQFLDNFYLSRIGIRILIGQHIELHEPQRDTYIGMICTKCAPYEVIQDAVYDARAICMREYAAAPEVKIWGDQKFSFAYVPSHLHHMTFELVKNSLRAVNDKYEDSVEEPPPIRIVVAEGAEDVTIKVSDEGGGIPRSGLPRIWTYLYSTANSPLSDMDVEGEGEDSPAVLAGYGYGLPLSRLYARYFGGDLQLFWSVRRKFAKMLQHLAVDILIPGAAILSIIFGVFLWYRVSKIQVSTGSQGLRADGTRGYLLEEEQRGEDEIVQKAADLQAAISEGATSFLFTEYKYMGVFMVFFAGLIFVLLSSQDGFSREWKAGHAPALYNGVFSTVSFLLGATTSIVSGFLGMKIAVYANARTALEARKGIAPAFMCAFRSGAVMGFLLAGNGLLVLWITIQVYHRIFNDDWHGLYEAIAGYGLGGSSIALFGRVGGGIYTKAADVGADLVGKVEKDIPEDDPRNPATIADNVGDNVGDIAGMGADLFGSFAESSCAALILLSVSSLAQEHNYVALSYPLAISAVGILVCVVTTFIATDLKPARLVSDIERTLKLQLVISTLLATPAVLAITLLCLPREFHGIFTDEPERIVKNYYLFFCVASGLWGGLTIGLVTEYYTSNAYAPVKELSDSCRTGAATNVIFGLALGYKSAIVPCLVIATCIFVSFTLAHMFGIACAALGFLTTLSTGLAIDAYGPISDNAGGIAEMAGLGDDIRERTDALDAAGNTTAAIGKGFAIGSAALVSLALFGAYITQADLKATDVSILDPEVFAGLLVGAMLPFWFSAMTMKSVGKAALAMVEEVRRQFNTIPGIMEGTTRPDYKRCVEISTKASLSEMIPPGALVMLTPVIVGVLFGTRTLAGVLAGALVSGVQMAVSMSNTGGAWDNAKKYIEAGRDEAARELGPKGSDAHKAAVVGDTVGDPLKDTSGPSLNILIKLMAVESLVFAPFFKSHTPDGLIFQFFPHAK
eukprot:jgi/Astpho2/3635/Aster-06926